jgi:hypothetical protein
MHPNKAEGIRGHNAKLRRMTRHYGEANPSMHKQARVNYPKGDGPEEAVGYGADSAAANARADRPARRAAPGNATATYRKGGRVKNRAMGGPAVAKPAKKGKGKTNISINITPPSAPTGVSGLPMGANPAVPPMPPPRPPVPMGGMPPGMPPGAGMPPPGMAGAPGPLGQLALQQKAASLLPRKRGGRVHADEAQDETLIKRMVKSKALRRAKGGPVKVGLKGGAMSGEGRIERNDHMDHKLRPTRGVEG